jgi:hypothetical protein
MSQFPSWSLKELKIKHLKTLIIYSLHATWHLSQFSPLIPLRYWYKVMKLIQIFFSFSAKQVFIFTIKYWTDRSHQSAKFLFFFFFFLLHSLNEISSIHILVLALVPVSASANCCSDLCSSPEPSLSSFTCRSSGCPRKQKNLFNWTALRTFTSS